MKKFLACLTTIALLLNLFSFMIAYAVTSTHLELNYDSMALGDITTGGSSGFTANNFPSNNTPGTAGFAVVDDIESLGHGQAAKLSYTANTVAPTPSPAAFNPHILLTYVENKVVTTGQKIHIGSEFMAKDKNFNNFGILAKYRHPDLPGTDDGWGGNTFLEITPSAIKIANQTILSNFDINTWYKVDLVINVNIEGFSTCDIYFNSKLVKKDVAIVKKFNRFEAFRYNLNVPNSNSSEVFFDNTVFSVYDENEALPVDEYEEEDSDSTTEFFDFYDFTNISGNGVGAADSHSGISSLNRSQMNTAFAAVGTNGAQSKIDSTPETGVFGKGSIDKSATIDNIVTKRADANINPFYQYLSTAGLTQFSGESTYITLQFAVEDLNYREFKIVGKHNGSDFFPSTSIIQSEQGQNGYFINIFGKTIVKNVMPKTWYQVDIIGDFNGGLFNAYLNGTKVLENETVPGNYTPIKELRLNMANRSGTKIYFDNFGVGIYGNTLIPAIKSATPTTSLQNVSINEGVKTVTIASGATVTVSDFLNSLTLSDVNAAKKIISNGLEKTTGNLEIGDYLSVTNGSTENYYRVDLKSHYFLAYKFDNYLTDNTVTSYGKIGDFSQYKFATAIVPNAPNTNDYQIGVYGKSPSDVSLHMKAEYLSSTPAGDYRDPYIEPAYMNAAPYADLTGKKLVLSASMLVKDKNSTRQVQLVSNTGAANWLAPFTFTTNGTITTGKEGRVVGNYELNKWYNLTAVINMGTTTYDLYINGEKADTSGLSISTEATPVIATNIQRLKLAQSVSAMTTGMLSETYYDDVQIYTGDYIPDPVSLTFSEQDYFVEDKSIALLSDMTAAALKSSITTTADMRIYSDNTYATILADGDTLETGNVLVLEKNNILDYYTILDVGLLLRATDDYTVDIAANTVGVYENTSAAKLNAALTTYSQSATASVVTSSGSPKTSGIVSTTDKIRVTDGVNSADYAISISVLINDNFNSYTSSISASGGTVPPGWIFGAIEKDEANTNVSGAIRDGDSNKRMLKFYSDATVRNYQFSIERNYPAGQVKGAVVLEVSMNAKDYKTRRMVTGKGDKTSGQNDFFEAFVTMDSNKNLNVLGIKMGEYELNKWYNLKILFDMPTGYMKVYNDGVLIYDGMSDVTNLTSITNIRMQQDTVKDAGPCETWYDDFKFYNIGKNVFTDQQFNITLKSDTLFIDNSLVPGIRIVNGTQASAIDLDLAGISYTELALFDSDGGEKDSADLEIGDSVMLKALDGTVAVYPVTDDLSKGVLVIKDSTGKILTKFTAGVITAELDLAVFKAADVKEYVIAIAQYNAAGALVKIDYVPTTPTLSVKSTLTADIEITSLTGTVKAFAMAGSSLQPLCNSVRIIP